MKWLGVCLLGVGLAGGLWAAEESDLSRYQVIIDRSPFGPVVPVTTVAIPNFAQRYQFSGLVVSNEGLGPVQAIIFDHEANRAYFKAAGEEMDDGVKVVQVDELPSPKVIIQSGLEKATLTFQERHETAAPPAPNRPGTAPPPMPPSIFHRNPIFQPRR